MLQSNHILLTRRCLKKRKRRKIKARLLKQEVMKAKIFQGTSVQKDGVMDRILTRKAKQQSEAKQSAVTHKRKQS